MECSVNPILSRDENDSLSSTEEVSQLSPNTSRVPFPQKEVCERVPEFAASSRVDTEMP